MVTPCVTNLADTLPQLLLVLLKYRVFLVGLSKSAIFRFYKPAQGVEGADNFFGRNTIGHAEIAGQAEAVAGNDR